MATFLDTTNEIDPDFDEDPRSKLQEALKKTKSLLTSLGPWAGWKAKIHYLKKYIFKIHLFQMCLTWEKFLLKIAQQETRNEKTIMFIRLVLTSLIHVKKTIEPKVIPVFKPSVYTQGLSLGEI